ncbi:hypothetical protein [Candidiatus Paracoxiella cheracis]|uniref:hypothetical protein n=1 Tax=Candidiatus Paracoxiella cheracis TaxID=3405120 RepID=UPI003BF5A271
MFAAKLGLQVDAVARDRKAFPFILQRLQDQNYRTVRLRGEVDSRQLPFASAKQLPLRNTQTGYDFVLNIEAEANECINKNDLIKKLSEAARIGRRGCQIVMGVSGEYEYAEIIRYAEAECGLTYLNQSIEENCQMEKVHTVRLVKN